MSCDILTRLAWRSETLAYKERQGEKKNLVICEVASAPGVGKNRALMNLERIPL